MRTASWLAAGGLFGAGMAMPSLVNNGVLWGALLIAASLVAVMVLSPRRTN